jgi:hypothetical protein
MLVPQFGKTFKLALAAFERVEEFCARIAEGPQHPLEEQETGGLDASAPESNTAALSSESVQQEDVSAAADDTGDLTEAERTTTTEMLSENDRSDDVPAVADGSEDEVIAQGKEGKDVLEKESGASQSQPQNGDLPTCGKCDGSLSFPFWYCIFCEGQSRSRYECHLPNDFADAPPLRRAIR